MVEVVGIGVSRGRIERRRPVVQGSENPECISGNTRQWVEIPILTNRSIHFAFDCGPGRKNGGAGKRERRDHSKTLILFDI
jgi:hypothetical protein